MATMISQIRGWVKLHPAEQVDIDRIMKDLPDVSEAMVRHTMRELVAENKAIVVKRGKAWVTKGKPRQQQPSPRPTLKEKQAAAPGERTSDQPNPSAFEFIGFANAGVLLRDDHQNMWIARRM